MRGNEYFTKNEKAEKEERLKSSKEEGEEVFESPE